MCILMTHLRTRKPPRFPGAALCYFNALELILFLLLNEEES